MLAIIAIIVISIFTFGAPLAFIGAQGMAATALRMAAMMVINAMIAPPKPPSTQQAAALAAPSPTYDLAAQGNYARLKSAIPVQYGRVRFPPDFASAPYAEFAGNEQYLYQLFCLGQGWFDVEAITIEDTPISSFPEITLRDRQPGWSRDPVPGQCGDQSRSCRARGTDFGGARPVRGERGGHVDQRDCD